MTVYSIPGARVFLPCQLGFAETQIWCCAGSASVRCPQSFAGTFRSFWDFREGIQNTKIVYVASPLWHLLEVGLQKIDFLQPDRLQDILKPVLFYIQMW